MKELEIRGVVGWETEASSFIPEFKEACQTGEKVRINISSPGGSVYQGFEIHNIIKEYEQNGYEIEIINQSLSGSVSTIIMCSIPSNSKKSKVKMQKNAMHFIHMPSGFSFGDEDKMRLEAEALSKIGDFGANMYAERTGLSKDFCLNIMKENAWFSAEECLSMNFVDEVIDGGKKTEPIKLRSYSKFYEDAPEQVRSMLIFEKDIHTLKTDGDILTTRLNTNNNQIMKKQWTKFLNFLG